MRGAICTGLIYGVATFGIYTAAHFNQTTSLVAAAAVFVLELLAVFPR